MSGRIRPSARKKTLYNVKCSQLSETDKKCIEEVFGKFELQKAEIEKLTVNMNAFGLGMKQEKQRADEWHREAELTAEKLDGAINAQETLQKALAEKNAEIEKLKEASEEAVSCFHRMESFYNIKCMELKVAKAEAIKEFAKRLKSRTQNLARMEYGGYTYFCVGYDLIDNLVKEMTEPSLLDKKFEGDTE